MGGSGIQHVREEARVAAMLDGGAQAAGAIRERLGSHGP
jgi:hypothetical protein